MTENNKKAKEPKKPVDWAALEPHYRAGIIPLKQLGKQFGCSDAAIIKHADKNGWSRDLKARVKEDRTVAIRDVDELDRDGFIYGIFIDAGGERLWKVGLAKSPVARMLSHQVSLPFEARIGIAYYVPNMRHEEAVLHQQFAAKHVRGEWFRLDQDDLEFMAGRSLLV